MKNYEKNYPVAGLKFLMKHLVKILNKLLTCKVVNSYNKGKTLAIKAGFIKATFVNRVISFKMLQNILR